jgi:coniferyl-aldehyde dehydrogenase
VLERLRTAWRADKPSLQQRRDDLGRLRHVLSRRLDAMDAAIRADFGHRSPHENLISEAMVTLAEIDLARRKLRRWAKPRRVGVGWKFWPARAEVRPSPVGVVGIISPWNYPVNLALVPLVSAIAAGNHVFLKPSEHTPRTSEFLPRPAGGGVSRPIASPSRLAAPKWAPRFPRCPSTICCSPAPLRSAARSWRPRRPTSRR